MKSYPLVPLSLSYLLCFGCGGPEKPAAQPASERTEDDYDPTRIVSATAEIGAMPEDATIYAFKDSWPDIQDCFKEGTERLEFIGGHIEVQVVVDSTGHPSHIFARNSTLGDRNTEKCMFAALRKAPWPAPVGGPIGEAENSFDFEVAGDVRPPVEWETDRVRPVLQNYADGISQCKRATAGTFTATVYVDTTGSAMGAGIAPPDKEGEAASDCLIDILSEAKYPSPGSWPAKVSFTL
jgi:hypothetical protein